MERWVVVVLVLVLATACGEPGASPDDASRPPGVVDTATEAASDAPLRLLVAGDSLAAGYYASTPEKGFSALVTTMLDGRHDVTPLLAAVPGARTWRIAQEVRDVTAGQGPVDVAILEAGANDVGPTTLREWRRWYRDLLGSVTATSPDAAIVCLGPWGPRAETAPYEEVVRRLCADHAYVGLSDLFERPGLRGPSGVETGLGTRDGYHPNDRGHAVITRSVVRALDRAGIA